MISGVVLRNLDTRDDERGFFREIVRKTDACFAEGFGQLSHSRMRAGAIKAWHLHRRQIDWWYVVRGALLLVMHDMRDGNPTHKETQEILMGDDHPARLVRVPTNVAHGCRALTDCELLYVTSHEYNPDDELRIPHNDPAIGYDWLKREIR
jgi:dTDP-4-dehydrorhamnose 3,5-epimerase